MNIILRISSVWFCVLALASRAMPAADPADLLKEIQPAIATVLTYDSEKKNLHKGSGFFINEQGYLITNYGILKGAHSAEVETYNGIKYPIKLILAESPESGLVKVSLDISKDTVKFIRSAVVSDEMALLVDKKSGAFV